MGKIIEILYDNIMDLPKEDQSKVIKLLEKIEAGLDSDTISKEDAYFEILGIADDYLMPLSPRDVGRLRRELGIIE
jgi:hypothetical protein